ncbi:MAG: PAS domain S-box protein [Deltaproteobacteria bacterium]|nr:PAS domain S-box protein [Deltaproteobacteria bacterium]
MPGKTDGQRKSKDLRRLAEEKASIDAPALDLQTLSPESAQQLLHELQVHQIELEMQNDELHRTQSELEASLARYFNLYDLAPVGHFTVSEKMIILETNLTGANFLGAHRNELINQPLSRFILPEDQDVYYHHRRRLFQTNTPQMCELRIIRQDGTRLWMRLDSTLVKDVESGKNVCQIIFSDIAGQKKAEEELRKSNERFELAVRGTNDGIWDWDISTNTSYFSERWYELLGYERHELPHRLETFESLLHPEDKERVFSCARQNLDAHVPYNTEYRMRTKSGEYLWFRARGNAIWDESGKPIRMAGSITDITGLKQIEEALLNSEERYRSLVETQTQMVTRFLPDGTLTFVNQALLNFFGKSREELIGEKWHPLLVDEDLKFIKDKLACLSPSDPTVVIENRVLTGNGDIRLVQSINTALFNDHGELIEIQSAGRDISAIKRAEEALRHSNERYQALIRTSMDGFFAVDMKGRIQEVNDVYCTMSGYSRETLLSMSIPNLNCIDSPENISGRIQKIISQGWDRFETKHRCNNGSAIDLQVSAVYVASQHLIMQFVNDITERKLLETSRNELLKQRQAILDHVPVGISYLCERRIIWSNSKMAEQFGYNFDELIGKTTELVFLSREDYEKSGHQIYSTLDSGQTFHKELLLKRKNNTLFWCSITGKAIDPKNQSSGSIWIVEDISKRKSDEEELNKAREQALLANNAKSEFLANMSHEIRTPLNAIIGFNKLLLDGQLTAKQRSFAEASSQANDNLMRIINDILDFSKIEASKMELDLASFEFEKALKKTVNMFQPLLDQKHLDLQLKISPSLPKVLIGDQAKFIQILNNLLSNAIKFTHSGSIAVKARLYNDSTRKHQSENCLYILVSVEDTGVGIPHEQLKRIFDAFVQGDSSSKKTYRGTGLGLAIAKRFVEIMGGSIWAESHPGVGTIFYFTVGFEIGSESDIIINEVAESHDYLTLNPLRIILAENDILNQKFGVEILERQGHAVTVANNGREVLDLLARDSFDLILMDISMPEIDGIEATKAIRNSSTDKSYKNIPIIAQTAHAIKGNREKFLEAGMDGYISKPITVALLVQEIAKVAPRFINRQNGAVLQNELGEQTKEYDRGQNMGKDLSIHPVIDIDALRRRFDAEKDIFADILRIFLDEFPKRMAAINTALQVGDLSKLSNLAHSLKGVAATVCAAEVTECADRINKAAQGNNLEEAKLYAKELDAALDRVRNISIDDYFSDFPRGKSS